MNEVELMLSGKMEMREFLDRLETDSALQGYMRSLIPEAVKEDPAHPSWKGWSYSAWQSVDFDLIRMIRRNDGFSRTFGGNLDAFCATAWAYTITHPDFKCTNRYYDEHGLSLDCVQDCFEGPEVNSLVEEIIRGVLDIPTKTKRTAAAKAKVREAFHVEGLKRPRWIQGPEWPMGKNSPMKYVSTTRKGEKVTFIFEDVDTGARREIEQFY